MNTWQQRTEQLFGAEKTEHLRRAHVLVVGVGGVGAYAAEMLCRAGIGEMTIVDADTVQPSNINRQLPATHATIGRLKTDVMRERLLTINPSLILHALPLYLTENDIPALLDTPFTFVVDAIDTIAPKCALIVEAHRRALPIVSSMGAGAKSDITKVQFARLEDTYHCGLSKAVRTRLRAKDKDLLKTPVVFSSEQADRAAIVTVEDERNKKSTTGTVSYMPAVFGCFLADYVIRYIISNS
ncbi:MAG: tRNA threonylcarbamoyladenosine dehydratase [Bacteroidaceae bacterium]|nr:tRNA threonylcarbamoyladenosine dehydratase [Bacteroidaceae bacterium]